MLHTGMSKSSIFLPINSSPKEQNGMKEEGDKSPSLFRMWTGWLLTVCKTFLSKMHIINVILKTIQKCI